MTETLLSNQQRLPKVGLSLLKPNCMRLTTIMNGIEVIAEVKYNANYYSFCSSFNLSRHRQ